MSFFADCLCNNNSVEAGFTW